MSGILMLRLFGQVLCMLYNNAVEMFYSLLAPHNSQESLCGYPSGIYTLLKKCTGSTFCLYIFYRIFKAYGRSSLCNASFIEKIFTFIPMVFSFFFNSRRMRHMGRYQCKSRIPFK